MASIVADIEAGEFGVAVIEEEATEPEDGTDALLLVLA